MTVTSRLSTLPRHPTLALVAGLTWSGFCVAQSAADSQATLAVYGNPQFARLFVGEACADGRSLPTEPRATPPATAVPARPRLYVRLGHDVPDHKESVSCTLTVSFVAQPGIRYAVEYRRSHANSKHLLACDVWMVRATSRGTFELEPSTKEEENKACVP